MLYSRACCLSVLYTIVCIVQSFLICSLCLKSCKPGCARWLTCCEGTWGGFSMLKLSERTGVAGVTWGRAGLLLRGAHFLGSQRKGTNGHVTLISFPCLLFFDQQLEWLRWSFNSLTWGSSYLISDVPCLNFHIKWWLIHTLYLMNSVCALVWESTLFWFEVCLN